MMFEIIVEMPLTLSCSLRLGDVIRTFIRVDEKNIASVRLL